MSDKADFAPIRWGYKKTREIARRMDGELPFATFMSLVRGLTSSSKAYRGDLTSLHPHFHPASKAACQDIDIVTAKQILPDGFTVGIHMSARPLFRIESLTHLHC